MAVSDSTKATIIETVNGIKELSIRKIEGKQKVFVFVETDGERGDARKTLSDALKLSLIHISEPTRQP